MTILQTIYHKRNELFEVELYKDEECTEAFDFTNVKNLYIDGLKGDISPLYILKDKYYWRNVYTPYMPHKFSCEPCDNITTLDDITPNLSKYIPEDNAVLFLSEQDMEKYKDCFPSNHIGLYINDGKNDETFIANNTESLINGVVEVKKGNATIFLSHGTQSELQKANEVAKELMGKYGVKEVNWFALHCFSQYIDASNVQYTADLGFINQWSINKIITTNSTGILKPENSKERLQVIDVKEIFEECGEIVKNNP